MPACCRSCLTSNSGDSTGGGRHGGFVHFPRDTCPCHMFPRGNFDRARQALASAPLWATTRQSAKPVARFPRRLWTLQHVLLKVVTRTKARYRPLTRARERPHASLVDLTPRTGAPSAPHSAGAPFHPASQPWSWSLPDTADAHPYAWLHRGERDDLANRFRNHLNPMARSVQPDTLRGSIVHAA